MDNLGLNAGYFLVQLLNLGVLCGWPLLSLGTLFALRQQKLTGLQQAIWVLIVLVVPFIGALAYWIVKPAAENQTT
ncbi:MAG: PLDc N-terminal domain-containing protein [Chloroflexota bacterium]